MMLNETCSCGASIEINRDDELKLIREWRRIHKCVPKREDLGTLTSQIEQATNDPIPEQRFGFQPEERKRKNG
jgi:hypothetical protein